MAETWRKPAEAPLASPACAYLDLYCAAATHVPTYKEFPVGVLSNTTVADCYRRARLMGWRRIGAASDALWACPRCTGIKPKRVAPSGPRGDQGNVNVFDLLNGAKEALSSAHAKGKET